MLVRGSGLREIHWPRPHAIIDAATRKSEPEMFYRSSRNRNQISCLSE